MAVSPLALEIEKKSPDETVVRIGTSQLLLS